jgi:hypothetical protein
MIPYKVRRLINYMDVDRILLPSVRQQLSMPRVVTVVVKSVAEIGGHNGVI